MANIRLKSLYIFLKKALFSYKRQPLFFDELSISQFYKKGKQRDFMIGGIIFNQRILLDVMPVAASIISAATS